MAAPAVLSFFDSLDHCRDFLKSDSSEATMRQCKRAVLEAYRTLTQERDWKYFLTQYTVQLAASYSTGTVAYTSSSRTLTLTTGTWPTWAAYGTVRISGVSYQVQTRTSSSALVLDANNCPVDDIASGTSYVIYRNVYTLPSNFRTLVGGVYDEQTASSLRYISPADWNRLDRATASSGNPLYYTVMSDPNLVGSKCIAFWPYPSAARTVQFIIARTPNPLLYTGYETAAIAGTVASTATDTAITGTGTSFAADMVGAFIRFSSGSTVPGGESDLNPYLEQKIIASRSSTTAIVTDSAMVNTLSGVKCRITSYVDLRPSMIPAFLRCCEWQISIQKGLPSVNNAERLYLGALMQAKENDADVQVERAMRDEFEYDPPNFTVGAIV